MSGARAIVERAGALYADPARRTSGALARNSTGTPCRPDIKKAIRWDATGALFRASGTNPDKPNDYDRDLIAAFCTVQLMAARHYRVGGVEVLCDQDRPDDALQVLRHAYRYLTANPPKDR